MDFVKREDQNLIDEDQYKAYLENLQKSHQMEADYQHTPISMEQLHQAMQSSLNASTIVHNFQLPLSPRQMSTLMLKTNHLSRNLNFNEIPAHIPRNLTSDIDLVQNLTHDLPQHLTRPEDLVLSQNLSRNLDLSLARSLSNELELQNSLAQSLVQNLTEQDLVRNLSNDLSQNLNRINDVLPQNLRTELPHNLSHELDLSHHLNRQSLEQEILNQNEVRRNAMVVSMQENLIEQSLAQRLEQNLSQRLEQNLGHRIDQNLSQRLEHNLGQRLVNTSINLHDTQRSIEHNDHMLPMPFHIKSEQEDDGYFYENINQNINVNGMNGHISLPIEYDSAPNIQQESHIYVNNNHNMNLPALNPIDLYSRPQNFVQNFSNNRENPQNLVLPRQFENGTPYQEEFKKFRQDGEQQNCAKETSEQPKENLKPANQNKIYFVDINNQSYQNAEKDDENSDKLTISEQSVIKGEYVCYKCNEVFPSKRGLKQHSKSCTEAENDPDEKLGKFSCPQCAYRCQSPAILKIHERVHTGEKPFKCTFCDYKSGQKNNVAKHILVHMKEKPFRCQYCEYRCAQKNNLVVHERTHTGFKPFACSYCDYRTVQKPNLVKHMYLHTDQKPFSCDQCSYRCVQKTNLTKHKQRHVNEKDGDKVDIKNQTKPYRPRQKSVKCPHCSYRCVQKSSLEKHMQFKHADQPQFVESFEQNSLNKDELEEESIQNLSVKKENLYGQDKEIAVQS